MKVLRFPFGKKLDFKIRIGLIDNSSFHLLFVKKSVKEFHYLCTRWFIPFIYLFLFMYPESLVLLVLISVSLKFFLPITPGFLLTTGRSYFPFVLGTVLKIINSNTLHVPRHSYRWDLDLLVCTVFSFRGRQNNHSKCYCYRLLTLVSLCVFYTSIRLGDVSVLYGVHPL